ncbi:MAG TPA: amidohydrolase family protein [Chthoniobacterales bacterium]|nr:amidohydrolase family protein [Chthoniobacterales bacterium]
MFLPCETRFPRSYLVVLALFLGACATSKPPPPLVVLSSSGPQAELVAQVPVVDIHTHTFNARFLPIRNIALGRRDKNRAMWLLRPPLLVAITNAVTRRTELDGLAADLDSEAQLRRIADEANQLASQLDAPAKPVTARELGNDPRVTAIEKIAEGGSGGELSDLELMAWEPIVSILTTQEKAPVDKARRRSEISHFLKCLSMSDRELVKTFRDDHQDKVALMVSHMMDLAPVFGQEEDSSRLLPFREQIRRFKKQQDNAEGRMLYFVAYNPFRDHYRGGQPGDALKVVKTAYEQQGAFGVKVYPPAGYTPFANRIPNPPKGLAWWPGRAQWNARYQPDGIRLKNEELDAPLLDLFHWAVKNDVPLFVHTGTSEVQARNGYWKMANPAHWKELLDKHEKDLKNIRICFGHAGDSGYWFGEGKNVGWGKDIFELCVKYPNIYCEFGVHDAIVYPDPREVFTTKLAELIEISRAKPYNFATKILYGSDWYMPMPGGRDRVNYLNAHKDAILRVPLKQGESDSNPVDTESLYKNYFYRNALAFLNAKKQLEREEIPGSLRAKLRYLVKLADTEDSSSRTRGAGAKLRARTGPGQRRSQEGLASFAR